MNGESNLTNKSGKRNKVIAGCGLAFFIFFLLIVLAGIFGSKEEKKEEATKNTQAEVKQAEQKTENTAPPVKQDEIKLKIIQPEKDSIEVSQDTYEIKGSVASADVIVEMRGKIPDKPSETISVDSEGNFIKKISLQKDNNAFDIIAKKGDEAKTKSFSIKRKLTLEERNAELKAEAKNIPYKELFRNIDDYKGAKIHYTGKVVQVIGDGNTLSTMRVNITKGSYGFWDDTVLLTNFDVESEKILEDDIIQFWGMVDGEESYQTVLGATVSVPSLSANIIKVIK